MTSLTIYLVVEMKRHTKRINSGTQNNKPLTLSREMRIMVSTFAVFSLSYAGRFFLDEYLQILPSDYYYITYNVVYILEGGSFGAVLWTHKVNYREAVEVRNGPNEVTVYSGELYYSYFDEQVDQKSWSHSVLLNRSTNNLNSSYKEEAQDKPRSESVQC